MIDDLPTILLCFGTIDYSNQCQSLTSRYDVAMRDTNDFVFGNEFEVNINVIPNSTYNHAEATLANYQGFPLVLGGGFSNKLEMLSTMEGSLGWIEYEGIVYPYSNE